MLWHNWLRKQKTRYDRYRVNKFFNTLETRAAVVDDKYYLLVYNSKAPELSYILMEKL